MRQVQKTKDVVEEETLTSYIIYYINVGIYIDINVRWEFIVRYTL